MLKFHDNIPHIKGVIVARVKHKCTGKLEVFITAGVGRWRCSRLSPVCPCAPIWIYSFFLTTIHLQHHLINLITYGYKELPEHNTMWLTLVLIACVNSLVPSGVIELGQNWFRQWVSGSQLKLPSIRSCDINLKIYSQEILKILTTKIHLKKWHITKLQLHCLGGNELTLIAGLN